MLSWSTKILEPIDQCIKLDQYFLLGYTFKATLLSFVGASVTGCINPLLNDAQQCISHFSKDHYSDREIWYLQAIQIWISGDMIHAAQYWQRILVHIYTTHIYMCLTILIS